MSERECLKSASSDDKLWQFFKEETSETSSCRLLIQCRHQRLHIIPLIDSVARGQYEIRLTDSTGSMVIAEFATPEIAKAVLQLNHTGLIVKLCRPFRQIPCKTLFRMTEKQHNASIFKFKVDSKRRYLFFNQIFQAELTYFIEDNYIFHTEKKKNSEDNEMDNVLLVIDNPDPGLSPETLWKAFRQFGKILNIRQNRKRTLYAIKFELTESAYDAVRACKKKGRKRDECSIRDNLTLKIEVEGFHLDLVLTESSGKLDLSDETQEIRPSYGKRLRTESSSSSLPPTTESNGAVTHLDTPEDLESSGICNYLEVLCISENKSYSNLIIDMLRDEGVFKVALHFLSFFALDNFVMHFIEKGVQRAIVVRPNHATSRTVELLYLDKQPLVKFELPLEEAVARVKQDYTDCKLPRHVELLFDNISINANMNVADCDKLIKFMLEYRDKRIAADFGGNIPARFLSPPLGASLEDPKTKAKKEDIQSVVLEALKKVNVNESRGQSSAVD